MFLCLPSSSSSTLSPMRCLSCSFSSQSSLSFHFDRLLYTRNASSYFSSCSERRRRRRRKWKNWKKSEKLVFQERPLKRRLVWDDDDSREDFLQTTRKKERKGGRAETRFLKRRTREGDERMLFFVLNVFFHSWISFYFSLFCWRSTRDNLTPLSWSCLPVFARGVLRQCLLTPSSLFCLLFSVLLSLFPFPKKEMM